MIGDKWLHSLWSTSRVQYAGYLYRSFSMSDCPTPIPDRDHTADDEDVFARIIATSGLGRPSQGETLQDETVDHVVHVRKKRRHTGFIPLPNYLLVTLKPLPGYAWVVFLVLWRKSLLEQSLTVSATSALLRQFGITRMQKARALEALSQLGLLTLTRRGRKNPLVTLDVDTPPWRH
jgi:hypothetical protein